MKLSGALRVSRQARQAERAGHGRRERSRASEWVRGFGQGVEGEAKRDGFCTVFSQGEFSVDRYSRPDHAFPRKAWPGFLSRG